MGSLKDKVVIVTGSSSGIGATTALEFARLGSKVTLTGRDEARLKDAADECRRVSIQDNIHTVIAELTNDDDCKHIVQQTVEKFGTVHILVNNAAMSKPGTIEALSMEDIDLQLQVNLRAAIMIAKLCVPYIKQNKGNIVNVSSVASMRGFISAGGYSISKAGLDMLTKVLSIELGRSGVRVNSVNPGWVKTPVHTNALGVEDEDEYYRTTGAWHPLNRVAEPVEVARVITFLASDAASFVSGNITTVDGAMHQTCAYSQIEMDTGLLGQ